MALPQIARTALRDATAAWHTRVDGVFSAADLGSRTGYGRFLSAQAAAHLPVEAALDAAGIDDIVPDWAARRRAALLCDDLAALGLAVPALEDRPSIAGIPAMLGAAYVLEGSRLGGAMLVRSVPDGFPRSFLSAGNSAAWRELIQLLDARLVSSEDTDTAITAACGIFALFECSGRRFLERGDSVGGR